jgi:hypothetical protein
MCLGLKRTVATSGDEQSTATVRSVLGTRVLETIGDGTRKGAARIRVSAEIDWECYVVLQNKYKNSYNKGYNHPTNTPQTLHSIYIKRLNHKVLV